MVDSQGAAATDAGPLPHYDGRFDRVSLRPRFSSAARRPLVPGAPGGGAAGLPDHRSRQPLGRLDGTGGARAVRHHHFAVRQCRFPARPADRRERAPSPAGAAPGAEPGGTAADLLDGAIAAAFAGLDMVTILLQMMIHPIWFTSSPGLSKYLPYLP